MWIKLTNKIKGNTFKYRDYFGSLKLDNYNENGNRDGKQFEYKIDESYDLSQPNYKLVSNLPIT